MTILPIDDLPFQSVLLSLQEVTEELRAAQDYTPKDTDEATALLIALFANGGLDVALPSALVEVPAGLDESAWQAAARRLLDLVAHDDDTAATATEVLADPPRDDRLGVEAALVSAVVLAGLVTWLQTKIDISAKRRNGAWDFDFRITKQSAGEEIIRQLVAVVARLLTGSSKSG